MNDQQRSAVQMALEALEETVALCINYESVEEKDGYQFTEAPRVIEQGKEAITALRWHWFGQPQEEKPQSDNCCKEADGCPTELAVLQRFWRQAQPQGEWVDLTDDDLMEVLCEMAASNVVNDSVFAKAVIAKFKEKNTPQSAAIPVSDVQKPVALGTAVQLFDEYVLAKIDIDPDTRIYTTPPPVEAMRIETLDNVVNLVERFISGDGLAEPFISDIVDAIRRMK